MAKLPRLSGKELIRFLARHQGLRVVRVHGSHHFLASNGLRTCVPVHGKRPLNTGTLRSILRDIDLSPKEFIARWEE